MHETYGRLYESGFGIWGVAMPDDSDATQMFRELPYAMPRLHTLAKGEEQSEAGKALDVTSFPGPQLVDEQGIFMAIDDKLRGSRLAGFVASVYRDGN